MSLNILNYTYRLCRETSDCVCSQLTVLSITCVFALCGCVSTIIIIEKRLQQRVTTISYRNYVRKVNRTSTSFPIYCHAGWVGLSVWCIFDVMKTLTLCLVLAGLPALLLAQPNCTLLGFDNASPTAGIVRVSLHVLPRVRRC